MTLFCSNINPELGSEAGSTGGSKPSQKLNKANERSEERPASEGGPGSGKILNVHAASFQPNALSATLPNSVSAALPSILAALEFEKLERLCNEERVLWEAEFYKGYFRDLIESNSFSVTGLKRASAKCWSQTRGHRTIKRDGRYIAEMFDPDIFRCGTAPVDSKLNVEAMKAMHARGCPKCRQYFESEGILEPSCYANQMMSTITHGWKPVIDLDRIQPMYDIKNNKKIDMFSESVDKEMSEMKDHHVLIRLEGSLRACHVVNPLGVTLKSSDIIRARTLVGIEVVDQESLLAASRALISAGYAKIKVRMTTDCSGSGLNRAAYSPSFSYPSFSHALRKVRRGCFLAKGDISRYFHSFPLAREFSELLVIEYQDEYLQYCRAPFGFTTCPYFASAWTAEMAGWMRQEGLDPAFMMDDFLETASTLEEAKARMARLAAILKRAGFEMAEEKFDYNQLMVFLGLQIDTVSMTIRIDPMQAKGFNVQLKLYIAQLERGERISESIAVHVAGKLGWFCEVVQSGRMHVNGWWDYLSVVHQRWNRAVIATVISDTKWWTDLLDCWEINASSEYENIIFNGEEILANPSMVKFVQSDASGPDGLGYVYSNLYETNYSYVSVQWTPDYRPLHIYDSHDAELRALCHYIEHVQPRRSLVMWISDSQSAVWSINKGNCHDPVARPILARILETLDRANSQIFATWVPRERNQVADHLTHLSTNIDREECQGSRF